ncbi:hypothetical protein LGW63_04455 [Streptococcus mutans]|uniref:hypothetical protein n=1 Tax=Streptococcus mutans TaxID=1309 RepID=UPI000268A7DE|nr:hypothetical protein [Streptococcus mutans]AFM81581.1 hypothetical protein SMUGS5_05350 [Streptococcus mutans GS-5]EMB82348.1 hypothetical protein SMU52_02963 [Streptococcus mutans NFSM2]MCB4976929.1 hypothetical protein [Streptococcus mutans]MDB8629624.1 hypothetical protein [Streptococcus mutans]
MTKENIELLSRPVLHATIWGVAPREVMGDYKFKKIKKQVQLEADHHCMICDRYVPHTMQTKDWIYTHEVYHVDKNKKCYTLEKFVGICKECHDYIHMGRLNILYRQGHVSEDYFKKVLEIGDRLLTSINLEKKPNDDFEEPYYMEYNNERFVNDINPEFAIEFHQKGGNILHYSGAKLLDQDIYYKRA